MASITVRYLDDGLKRRLRIRAAEHGRSMEEEAREILRHAIGKPAGPRTSKRLSIAGLPLSAGWTSTCGRASRRGSTKEAQEV